MAGNSAFEKNALPICGISAVSLLLPKILSMIFCEGYSSGARQVNVSAASLISPLIVLPGTKGIPLASFMTNESTSAPAESPDPQCQYEKNSIVYVISIVLSYFVCW